MSIIIPVYNNSHDEILRCFNSIKEQKCNDYEVIVVDDGSSESCASFLDEITMKLNRFRVIHQKNQGVSMARNNGVKEAAGQYIAFIDADDMITKNYFMDVKWILQKEQAAGLDVIYGFVKYEVNPKNQYEDIGSNISFDIVDEFHKSLLIGHMIDGKNNIFKQGTLYINRGPVAKVVKKSLVLGTPFDIHLNYGEDNIWNLEILKKAQKIIFVKRHWYVYIENPFSAQHRFTIIKENNYINTLKYLWHYIDNDDLKVKFLSRLLQFAIELEKSYYFFNVDYILKKPDISRLAYNHSWSQVLRLKYAIHLDKKDLIKYILLKMRCLGFYFWICKKLK
ncbi:glycosyltransferase family 2 protein [uncultured Dialister sp.]|uniref:glycosyltransferase family 2 protein n=1 Tax=uncultured Dialister sp. TaxID=278064 RepID=UPI0026353294|nr:glycosyltransferase family 2 protein [uncultured Dialister sp.]